MLCAQRSSPWAFSLDTLSFELGYEPTSCGVKARQTPAAGWHRRQVFRHVHGRTRRARTRPAPLFIAAVSNSP